MGVRQKVKQRRADRKADREAIARNREDELRAGEEPPPQEIGEPFDEYKLGALKQ